ncbi:hypothetical protein GZ981_003076 [Clostridium perfringens]
MTLKRLLNKKLRELDISSRELSELKLELLDTAEEMKKDFLNEGFSEKEANEKVINTLQIDELINSTKESYLKANLINTRILSSLFLGIYTIFILICISNTTNGGGYLSKGAYLPFKFLYNLFNSNKPLLDNVFVLDQLFILLLFIPFGILIPIVINKYNSLKPSLIIFLLFNVIISLLHFYSFNFDLTIFRIISSILGFYIIKILKIKRKNEA